MLLTVSGTIADELGTEISQGRRPRADFLELSKALNADLLDQRAARKVMGPSAGWLVSLLGPHLLVALACFRLRHRYRAILTDGEQVGIPLAALLKLVGGARPLHAMIAHVISVPKKTLLLDWFRLHTHIDRFICYSSFQRDFVLGRWKLKAARVACTPFMVDERFFYPDGQEPEPEPLICSVGLEQRDYETLLAAVDGLHFRGRPVQVYLAAASPWSRQTSPNYRSLPNNVTVGSLEPLRLRELYRRSSFVVVPLLDVPFQAGVTTILEAMAMGKAVVCTRARGQTDVVVDEVTGLYVKPQDPDDLRGAILRLLSNPAEAQKMGDKARQSIQDRGLTLDSYCRRLSQLLPFEASAGSAKPETQGTQSEQL